MKHPAQALGGRRPDVVTGIGAADRVAHARDHDRLDVVRNGRAVEHDQPVGGAARHLTVGLLLIADHEHLARARRRSAAASRKGQRPPGIGVVHGVEGDDVAPHVRRAREAEPLGVGAVAVVVLAVVVDVRGAGVDGPVTVVAVGAAARDRVVAIAVDVRTRRRHRVAAVAVLVDAVVHHLGGSGVGGGARVVAVGAVRDVAGGLLTLPPRHRRVPVGIRIVIDEPFHLIDDAGVVVVDQGVAVVVHGVAHLGRGRIDGGAGVVAVGVVDDVASRHAARRGGRRGVPVGVAVGVGVIHAGTAGLIYGAVAVVVHTVARLRRSRIDGRAGRRVVAVGADVGVVGNLGIAEHHPIGTGVLAVREDVGGGGGLDGVAIVVRVLSDEDQEAVVDAVAVRVVRGALAHRDRRAGEAHGLGLREAHDGRAVLRTGGEEKNGTESQSRTHGSS